MTREFGGNEPRRVRIVREHFQRFFAVFLAAVVEGVAHHDFLALRVKLGPEHKFGIAARLANGPAGEALGHFDHVLLRVAGVDADGVQLHHFAAVVFVQAALLLLLPAAPRRARERPMRPDAEIPGHGRQARRGKSLDSARGASPFPAAIAANAAGIDALPVIEEEEHRRAFGGGDQQSPRNLPMVCGRIVSRT